MWKIKNKYAVHSLYESFLVSVESSPASLQQKTTQVWYVQSQNPFQLLFQTHSWEKKIKQEAREQQQQRSADNMLKHDSSWSNLRAGGGRVVAASSSSAVNTMIKNKNNWITVFIFLFLRLSVPAWAIYSTGCGERRRGRCRESRRLDTTDGFLAADASIAALLGSLRKEIPVWVCWRALCP